MQTKTVTNLYGLLFLDKIEQIFMKNGLDGVVQLVKDSFPVGGRVKMISEAGNSSEPVFKIERVTVLNTKSGKEIKTIGDKHVNSIIRSFKLPYLETPFQINIYGHFLK